MIRRNERMPDSPVWTPVSAENLVRHRSGTYFLQAKINGKKIRRSLKTDNLRQAKVSRDTELKKIREESPAVASGYETLGDAISTVEAQVIAEPEHKASTKTFYVSIFKLIRKSLPLGKKTAEWTKDEAKQWWADFAKDRNSSQSNISLHVVRRAMRQAVDVGARTTDPTSPLKRKRTPKPAVEELPGLEVLESLLASMRREKGRGKGAADIVEFLAWSGVRIGELVEIEWTDIDGEWLTVTGGEGGTKNHEIRRVPINSKLAALISRLRYPNAEGRIFSGSTPRKALNLACDRIGIPRLRIHDLRHWFATHAIEKGVDIPTVAKWLGHKDGGALAMRVYGHLRDEHSLSAAKKLG